MAGLGNDCLWLQICKISHVQGVVSQPFDFSTQLLESILLAQKIALKYQ